MSEQTVSMGRIESIFFQPPMALARVGGSDTPLECFVWDNDRSPHGALRTVVRPAPTLLVMPDGSLRVYQPSAIQFRDNGLLRPVAPFFELWARLDDGTEIALTADGLRRRGLSTDALEFVVTVSNRKAERRTGKASCGFTAEARLAATDHARHALLAHSPHSPGEVPLVAADKPIPLGHIQVIRPIAGHALDVDLDVVRLRFTPATGQVYGPDDARQGPASPLHQGIRLPASTLAGRVHEIVPEKNRILNRGTAWSGYSALESDTAPQPADSYDGTNVGDDLSWGVVDDTCDGLIEARLVVPGGKRLVAHARVASTCPDWAPDRRPFYSIADDLADRDEPVPPVNRHTLRQTQLELADLFDRTFETASLINLDALRLRALNENRFKGASEDDPRPRTDGGSMTELDRHNEGGVELHAELTADLFKKNDPEEPDRPPPQTLPYAEAAHLAHQQLADLQSLMDFLAAYPERVRHLVRPPVGSFAELAQGGAKPSLRYLDPRLDRDRMHDMRMPPYMRDSDAMPLSLTRRQHALLMRYLDLIGGDAAPQARPLDAKMRRERPSAPQPPRKEARDE